MSSPSSRRTRNSQSATPRSTRSQAQRSSPAPGPSSAAAPDATPRPTRASQLASSPLFFASSPAGRNNAPPSSPLRQQSSTQSTESQARAAPSSPLRQQTDTQSTDGDKTPRASHLMGGTTRTYSPALTFLDPSANPRQNLLLSATKPVRVPAATSASQSSAVRAAACSLVLSAQGAHDRAEVTLTPISLAHQHVCPVGSSSMTLAV